MSDINKLTVKFDNSSVFTDYTEAMHEFGRDSTTIAIETADFIYLGREKPFNAAYIEMGSTVNSIASLMTAEYYDESAAAWTALPLLVNEPEVAGTCLARSGFIKWDKGIDTDDWTTVAIDSITQYWVRLSVSVNITATTSFTAIGILLSDDESLKAYAPKILSMLPVNENDVEASSFVQVHKAARDMVLLELNRGGITKSDVTDGHQEWLDAWDLHDINNVAIAAAYACLYLIYWDNFDVENDQYFIKAKEYKSEFKTAMESVIIEVDLDDDGIVDTDEQGKTFGTVLVR
mgnify:CR=1 FL=1